MFRVQELLLMFLQISPWPTTRRDALLNSKRSIHEYEFNKNSIGLTSTWIHLSAMYFLQCTYNWQMQHQLLSLIFNQIKMAVKAYRPSTAAGEYKKSSCKKVTLLSD